MAAATPVGMAAPAHNGEPEKDNFKKRQNHAAAPPVAAATLVGMAAPVHGG